MSLKGIELQIAIPKTFDAGKVAEQKQQEAQMNRELADALVEKQALRNKETATELEPYAKTDPDGKDSEDGREDSGEHRTNILKGEEREAQHPYKGANFDTIG